MKFRRLSDDRVFDAKLWQRHGDHPIVRPATDADLPASMKPGKFGWLEGFGIVLPGDWILVDSLDGTPRVVLERTFRREYEPTLGTLPSSS